MFCLQEISSSLKYIVIIGEANFKFKETKNKKNKNKRSVKFLNKSGLIFSFKWALHPEPLDQPLMSYTI